MSGDLPTRLLAAIAEVEQREALGVHLKLTRPSLLLSLCEAHREIVEEFLLARKALEAKPDDQVTLGAGSALWAVIVRLAHAYDLMSLVTQQPEQPQEQP